MLQQLYYLFGKSCLQMGVGVLQKWMGAISLNQAQILCHTLGAAVHVSAQMKRINCYRHVDLAGIYI